MEEEDNKQLKIVTSIGDSWIICRSQSHSGRVYYFNTLTGKAVWNLSDAEKQKAQIHSMCNQEEAGTNMQNCPEPTEPPVDAPLCTQQQPIRGPRIYNKQIINNQFTKPYSVPSFPPYAYNSLNNMNNAGMNGVPAPVYNPWSVPPPHQVYLTPMVHPFPNQPIFNGLGLNQPPQNIGLANSFMNELPNNGLYQQGVFNNGQYQNFNARMDQRLPQNMNKSPHDLRNVLSAKRKVFNGSEDEKCRETYDRGNCQDEAEDITLDDLCPSDIDDEWLQQFDETSKPKISSIWRLASGREKKDYWFLVVSAMVLLNHVKFLTSLLSSDERARVVTPLAARKLLRRATGAAAPALALRARRANRFASQQMNRLPAGLDAHQDGSIVNCCLGLLQQNYCVIYLTDDVDFQNSENEFQNQKDVVVFTVNALKEYLTLNASVPAPTRNITVTIFPDNDGNVESITKAETPTPKRTESNIDTDHAQLSPLNEEIKLETVPKKRTVNASVQTDFLLEPTRSDSVNSLSHVETIEADQFNMVLQSDSGKEEPNAKRIKLVRKQPTKRDDPVKKTFKWRKRRETNTSARDDSKHSSPSPFASLMIQQNDNAVDLKMEMENAAQDKETASDVISNSVDSDSMFKLNRNAIVSDASRIFMFEISGEQMDDRLSKGCEEWVSRFVQIMEEALSQVLRQQRFADAALPPPWSVQEATVCVKKQFEGNANVEFACYKLAGLLHEISDSRGKIHSDLNPSNFMLMYSYGVNLIEALQSELRDSEDIQIALKSLSVLLDDIRQPSMSHNMLADTFNCTDDFKATTNTPEKVNTTAEASANTTLAMDSPKKRVSPRKKTPRVLNNLLSPSKYSLRSTEQKKKLARIKSTDRESSFFSGLGLQKNVTINGEAIRVSFRNSQSDRQPSPVTDTTDNPTDQKIIRTFNRCIEFEKKLKHQSPLSDHKFTADNHCSDKEFYLENGCGSVWEESTEKYSSPKSDVDAMTIVKWFIGRTTWPIHRVLMHIHKFCMATNEDLKHKGNLKQEYKNTLFEKIAKLNTHLDSLRKYLDGICHRKEMKSKFSDMMKELDIEDFIMDDSQEADYRATVGKYVEQAGVLIESLNLIANEMQPQKTRGQIT